MKNLTIHKIALGVLMMCVLAFGVQGTVEAQTLSVSGDGSTSSQTSGTTVILVGSDPGTTALNRFFNIAVSNVKGAYTPETSISAGLNRSAHTADTVDITFTANAAFASANPRVLPTGLSAATFAGNTLTFAPPTSLTDARTAAATALSGEDTPANQSALDRADAAVMNWRGSGTIRVNYSVTAYGEFTITVNPSWDNSPNSTKTIEAYVARASSQSAQAGGAFINADATNTTTTPRTASGAFSVLLSPANQYTQVNLTITGGKFVESSGSYFSGNKLFTLSAVKEFTSSLSKFTNATGVVTANVQPNVGQIATVTASVPGSGHRAATYKVTYFSSAITVEKDTDDNRSGDNQFGPTQSGSAAQRRPFQKQLAVRVTDGYGTTARGVGGQWVEFGITNSGGTAVTDDPKTGTTTSPWLRAVSRGVLWDRDNDGHVSNADDNFPNLVVKTDGSGYAKVHFVPGDDAGSYRVRYRVVDQTSHITYAATPDGTFAWQGQTFTATVEQSNTSGYVINKASNSGTTTTPQLRNAVNLTRMTVNVQDSSPAAIPNARVEFSVDGGRIALSNSNPNYQNRLSTVTDSTGNATVYVQTNSGSTAMVTAQIAGTYTDEARHVVTYFSQGATLRKVSGDNQKGALGGRLDDPIVVEVLDGTRPVADQIVMFDALAAANNPQLAPLVGAMYDTDLTTEPSFQVADGSTDERDDPLYIKTDSNGQASAYWALATGDAELRTATVSINGLTSNSATSKTFTATAEAVGIAAAIEIVPETNNQATLANGNLPNPLKVRVRNQTRTGRLIPGEVVTFTTTKGTLSVGTYIDPDGTTVAAQSGDRVTKHTDIYGEAEADYNIDDASGAVEVVASIRPTGGSRRDVTFTINGTGSGGQQQNPQQNQPTRRASLLFSPTSLTGSPGETRTFRVTARDADGNSQSPLVTLSSAGVQNVQSPVPTGTPVTITLPSRTTFISATASGYPAASLSIRVQVVPSSIVSISGNNQSGEPGDTLSSPFVVEVRDSNNNALSGQTVNFSVTAGGGTLSSPSATTDSSGRAETRLTLGSAGGTNTVEARVSGVSSVVTFTATADEGPSSLVIAYGDGQESLPNRRLGQPLGVQVLDSDGNGISGVWVNFTLTSGSGRVVNSRGRARTDTEGIADGEFVPSAVGTAIVEASFGDLTPVTFTIYVGGGPDALVKVSGDRQSGSPGARLANPFVVEVLDDDDEPLAGITVTFSVTGGGGNLSETSVPTNNNGRAQTLLTLGDEPVDNTVVARVAGLTDRITFKATSGAEVLVSAAQRPPMYWISRTEGKLHRLVDAEVENLVPAVQGITSLAVDTTNNLLYFGVKTNGNRGAIRRANLNGRNAEVVRALSSAPVDIAVADGTLYWLTKGGRIRSVPTEGTAQVRDVAIDLPNPPQIALSANGFLYWTEPLGRLQRVRLTGTQAQQRPQTVATGLGEVLSLAIGRSKVYWTARNGGGGVLQRSNLDGTVREDLKTFSGGVPMGLGVDDSDNKLYWTRPQGKLQRASLRGRFVKDIVTGLSNPGAIALGVAAAPSTPRQPANNQQQDNQEQDNQQPTTYSVYDINEDGAVNNADTRLVAADVGNSGAAIKNKRADVDGSGTVDVTDLILVLGNLDDDVAAPAIEIDVKALDVDFDRVQEQVEVLLASGDRSIAAQRALLYLQHLLASTRPDETVLLANYPNPFNPETWIPYHLAASTDVRVNIYDAQGTLVRVLTLGHQTAGYYTSRSRAAYWDGKNALGERVASGIYFYQLQTDTVSPMRKMVILK